MIIFRPFSTQPAFAIHVSVAPSENQNVKGLGVQADIPAAQAVTKEMLRRITH
jgi:hypothetical protein